MKNWWWGVVVVVVGIFLFFSGFNSKWSLFYYPEGCLGCVDDWILQVDMYDSKEACFFAGNSLRDRTNNPQDTFECGVKCKKVDETGYLCKETFD